MEILVKREIYTDKATRGRMFIDDTYVCFTLEDMRRHKGVKIPGSTCLPAGRYHCSITPSRRFGRDMVLLNNCANGYTCQGEGISFTGIRIHGGNNHEDTSGCILVAHNAINDYTIQGTAEAEIKQAVESAILNDEQVWLEVRDS